MRRDGTPSLHEVQERFAAALREAPVADPDLVNAICGPDGDARIGVYANNARQFFREALASTYVVLKRRVGDDFFRQLAHEYRAAHPSQSGDLHWVGRHFPGWLAQRLAGGDYAWLADLARLEWACEESMVAPRRAAVGPQSLATLPPEALDDVRLQLQPSLRLVSSDHPIGSVWQANRDSASATPVDLSLGAEHCACACLDDHPAVYRLPAEDYALVGELARGASLGEAVTFAGADAATLVRVLAWAFTEGLVVQVISPSVPA